MFRRAWCRRALQRQCIEEESRTESTGGCAIRSAKQNGRRAGRQFFETRRADLRSFLIGERMRPRMPVSAPSPKRRGIVREGGGAFASTRGACAPQKRRPRFFHSAMLFLSPNVSGNIG